MFLLKEIKSFIVNSELYSVDFCISARRGRMSFFKTCNLDVL